MSDFEPFYDVSRSYEDNYEQGPFGAFAEALKDGNGADAAGTTSEGASEGALATFLGQPVNLPFGIPAGPLLNSRFTTAAFHMGFDLATYKTVRSRAWGCNPFPNVLAVHPKSADGSLTPGSAELDEGVLSDSRFPSPTASVCPRRALTSGSRTCAPPSRPPVPVKCWSRASKARVWRA